jgi:hypothetical protein
LREWCPFDIPDKVEKIHARAFVLSRLNDTHEQSIALARPRHYEMLLPLRPVAGRTTEHGYIGT